MSTSMPSRLRRLALVLLVFCGFVVDTASADSRPTVGVLVDSAGVLVGGLVTSDKTYEVAIYRPGSTDDFLGVRFVVVSHDRALGSLSAVDDVVLSPSSLVQGAGVISVEVDLPANGHLQFDTTPVGPTQTVVVCPGRELISREDGLRNWGSLSGTIAGYPIIGSDPCSIYSSKASGNFIFPFHI